MYMFQVCHKLIDRLLEHTASSMFGDITHTVDVICSQENHVLQSYIDAFAEAADSPYGCLMVSGRIAVATSKWWEMSASELLLLTMLVSSLPQCTSRDLAVFLPDSSPTVSILLFLWYILIVYSHFNLTFRLILLRMQHLKKYVHVLEFLYCITSML